MSEPQVKSGENVEDTANVDVGNVKGADGNVPDAGATADKIVDIYRPEGMPDHYVGANNNETIDKLYKAADGFRKENAKKSGVPEKLDDYKIDLPEDVASNILRAGDDGVDPVFEHMREIFHQKGIAPAVAAEIMAEYGGQLQAVLKDAEGRDDNNSGDDLADFDFKSLGGAEKAKPIIDAHNVYIEGLKSSGKITDKLATELKVMTQYSEGLEALNELRGVLGDKKIPVSFQSSGSFEGLTEADLNKKMEDPKYWREKDPQFIAEVTEGFQKLYNKPK